MSRAGRATGIFARSDLVYREIDKKLAQDAATAVPEDEAWDTFDGVTKKVIEHLDASNIEDWDGETWKTFQKLLSLRPKQGKDVAPELKSMTTSQLKKLSSATNSADP